jgi:hypothetical protein
MDKQSRILIIAAFLSVTPIAGTAATATAGKTGDAAETVPKENCYRCGTIEAIS